jgi:hypothetical protein
LQVLAEVNLNSPAEDILNQAGFRPYADQQIWKLKWIDFHQRSGFNWIPISKNESQQILSAYHRFVPANVHHVESLPFISRTQGLLACREDQLVGLAYIRFGPRGILIDFYLDPEIKDLDDYLRAFIARMPYQRTRDLFIRVRSYQERLASALERLDAQPGPQQKAVVKKLAVHYNAKQTFRVQSFEKQPDITTPISNTKIEN